MGQGLGRPLRAVHHRQPGQGGGRGGHGLGLGTAAHHHQSIEAPLHGPLGHGAVQFHAAVAELEHGAKHRKAATRLTGQQIQRRQHGLGGGVVGLIEHGEPPLLQAAVAAAGHGHIQLPLQGQGHAQVLGHRQGQQKVAGIVTPLQGQLHRLALHQEEILLGLPLAHQAGLAGAGVIGQGHPQGAASPGACKRRLQQGIAGGDHHQPLGVETAGDLAFGGGDGLAAAEAADVGGADVGDHRHGGFGGAAEPIDLTEAPHAHLHHHGPGARAGLEQGEGHADVVVFVAAAGHNRPQRRQGGTNQLAGGGFAGGAGHRHHRGLQLAPVQQRHLLVGVEGVIDEPMEQSGRSGIGAVALHQGGLGTALQRLLQKPVAIEALPHQGDEQLPGGELAAVGADGPERGGGVEAGAAGLAPLGDQVGHLQLGCGHGCRSGRLS